MEELQTTSEVIEELGGVEAVARMTHRNKKAVSMWKTANKLPFHTQHKIISALVAKDKSVPLSLWGMVTTKKGSAS